MNESIKFTADDPRGKYATDDTGVMVGVVRDYTNRPMAVVRDTNDKYVLAPLSHLEHVSEGD